MKTGYTTGTCAAAAAGAAAWCLSVTAEPSEVTVALPSGETVTLPVAACRREGASAWAEVVKDAGDDPDVTHGATIRVRLDPGTEGINFRAGEGVGTVTKAGLQIPPGEPAINPVPRAMITAAIRAVTATPLTVTVAIPGGEALAAKTFNPRLGILGGLSILGTSGIVRPYSHEAIAATVRCSLDVAMAAGVRAPILVPGNIGARAATALCHPAPEQLVEVSNAWGEGIDHARGRFERLLAVGHPGKLAKLAAGEWDTHSSRSDSPVGWVRRLARETLAGLELEELPTVQGIFDALPATARANLGATLAARVRQALAARFAGEVAVILIDMQGAPLGAAGEVERWQRH